jgi:hypothetical protein
VWRTLYHFGLRDDDIRDAQQELFVVVTDGAMREEIELLRVEALCDGGDRLRWKRAIARFDRRFPGSPLRVHLRRDCFE